jgi:hypothetical protein
MEPLGRFSGLQSWLIGLAIVTNLSVIALLVAMWAFRRVMRSEAYTISRVESGSARIEHPPRTVRERMVAREI